MEIELGKIIEAGKEKKNFIDKEEEEIKIKCGRDFYRTFRPSKNP